MLLGIFVFYHAKATFLQNMLLDMFFCLFVCFLGFFLCFVFVCNHCCSESFLTQQALHLYNISCIVVPQWQSAH
jgi:hypothetical protein